MELTLGKHWARCGYNQGYFRQRRTGFGGNHMTTMGMESMHPKPFMQSVLTLDFYSWLGVDLEFSLTILSLIKIK